MVISAATVLWMSSADDWLICMMPSRSYRSTKAVAKIMTNKVTKEFLIIEK